jgi:uncharacterized protein
MIKKENKLLIFTKSPILGEVKTRLQPDYSPEESLIIYKKLLFDTLERTKNIEDVDVELCCAPDRNTSFFLHCENDYPITLSNQEGADLGERMAFSISVTLQTYAKVVVIGTDCPDIDEGYIQQAFSKLNEHDAVIGPAVDGGYVLLGLKEFSTEIFSGITWGEDSVFKKTQDTINRIGWTCHHLETKHDVDRPEDLHRYQYLLNELK